MAQEKTATQFSYMAPGLLFLLSIPFLFIHGLEPYRDWLMRRNWVPVKATVERAHVVSKDAPDSLVLKDTGTQYKVRLVLRYSPRSLLGAAAMDPQYPPWLLLPKTMFHWTLTPETYDSVMDAHAAMRNYAAVRDFELYINPGMPDEATMFRWSDWLWIRVGFAILALSFLSFGFLWVLNGRAVKRLAAEEEEKASRFARHHSRRTASAAPENVPDSGENGTDPPLPPPPEDTWHA